MRAASIFKNVPRRTASRRRPLGCPPTAALPGNSPTAARLRTGRTTKARGPQPRTTCLPARTAQFYLLDITGRTFATRLRAEVTLLSAVLPDGIDVSISPTATGIKNAPCQAKGGATPLRSGRHRDVKSCSRLRAILGHRP